MFSRKVGLFLLLMASLIASCSDHDPAPKRGTNFPMEKENYWIYQTTIIEFDGTREIFPYLDSVWIEEETTQLRGNTYWIRQSKLDGASLVRDSVDCVLMDQSFFEQIVYSTNRDTLLKRPPAYQVMTHVGEKVTVPAGEFTSTNCMTLLRKDPSGPAHSDLPSFDKNFYIGEQYICSSEIGLIKHVYYYLGGTVEIELMRYKIVGVNL